MAKILEKSGNFVSPEKRELCEWNTCQHTIRRHGCDNDFVLTIVELIFGTFVATFEHKHF